MTEISIHALSAHDKAVRNFSMTSVGRKAMEILKTSDFYYDLPKELIAKTAVKSNTNIFMIY